ncbi:MAG: tRNA (adenosine(37)-N6)-threonylcarbamoyltransferase complex dimerization subunit type 1 TsaB, partial [Actinobacteria bacterium]|nr:tRNA (adenosine(37)-N6)-threonylcarbamoyltransferase complex dimerization subunit type 1 TsaB [Actinomycetota bacterium]
MSGGVVLAFDTATAATVVGLSLDGRQVSSLADRPPGGAGPRHAETLLALCEQALAEGSIRWADLDRFGVGVGPGTFT